MPHLAGYTLLYIVMFFEVVNDSYLFNIQSAA